MAPRCVAVALLLVALAGCGSPVSPDAGAAYPIVPDRAFGVFVGIAEYPLALPDLAGCDEDAVQVWASLGGSVPPWPAAPQSAAQQIRLLTYPIAAASGARLPNAARGEGSKESILQAIRELAALMTASDLFVFYFSGHAEYNAAEGRAYLYTSGVHEDRISDVELADALAAVPADSRAANVVVILDGCQTGGFAAMASACPGVELLASADTAEKSVIRGDYSIFTSALIQGLGGGSAVGPADANADGAITPTELFKHARWATGQMTDRQHPVFQGADGLREMALKCRD